MRSAERMGAAVRPRARLIWLLGSCKKQQAGEWCASSRRLPVAAPVSLGAGAVHRTRALLCVRPRWAQLRSPDKLAGQGGCVDAQDEAVSLGLDR